MAFSGKKLTWASIFGALTFVALLLTHLSQLDAYFMDVGLALAALALFELAREKNFKEEEN